MRVVVMERALPMVENDKIFFDWNYQADNIYFEWTPQI